jgi:transglutaminase-like putative cysteine protease
MGSPTKERMVRLQFSIELHYDIAPPGGDFIFNIHAAHTAQQTVLHESLQVSQAVPYDIDTDPVSRNRYLRLQASAGHLQVLYAATVDIHHHTAAPHELGEVPVCQLPGAVLPYIYPSRYCQSDRLQKFAFKEFGHLPQGYSRAQAIRDWVLQRVSFESNTTHGSTSALDTVIDRVGVCRDFAHLMIALCRAVNMPARFATGIDYGANPSLGPTDFHAYVEVYLNHRWYLFDPSGSAIPMGFVRFATGRDAADAAFATLFGSVASGAPIIQIQAIPNGQGELVVPRHVSHALSSDGV